MSKPFKAKVNRLNTWTVDDLRVTRRTIKRVLASGALTVASLCESVRNIYKQNLHVKIDVCQTIVALRQLVAEGDVTRDGDDVWLTKHKPATSNTGAM